MSSNGERARDRPDAIRMDPQMPILWAPASGPRRSSGGCWGDAGLELTRVLPAASPAGLAVIEATRV